jgi:hypothetical protein
MNKKLIGILVVIAILSLLTISALAGMQIDSGWGNHVEGVWTYLPVGEPLVDVVGNHTFMKISDTGDWNGGIFGDADDYGEVALHNVSGYWYYFGTVPFESATVKGKTGALVISVFGWRPDMTTDWEGTWEIISGSGELANIEGHGTWDGPGWQGDPLVPGEVDYTGKINFNSSD